MLADVAFKETHSPSPYLRCGLIQEITKQGHATAEDFQTLPVLVQGFYDSHMHPAWVARFKTQLNCHEKSAREIVRAILANPSDEIIFGFGWEESALQCSLEEFARQLVAIPRRVVLHRVCRHMAFVSDKGFLKDAELAGIPEAPLTAHQLAETWREIQSAGIDATADLLVTAADYTLLREKLPDALLFADIREFDFFQTRRSQQLPYLKYFLDGSIGARTAWLTTPYADGAAAGSALWSDAALANSMDRSLTAGFLLAFHAIGDAALDQLLRVSAPRLQKMRAVCDAHRDGPKLHRIEHAQVCRDDQIELLKAQGIWCLGLQPCHRLADAEFAEIRLGSERLLRWGYRLQSFLTADLKISIGSDAPIAPFDPEFTFRTVRADPRDTERITPGELYRLYCVEGRQNAGVSAKILQAESKAWLSTLHL